VDVVPATTSQVGPVGGGGDAVALGTIEGMCTLVGVALLIYRRRAIGPVFMAITRNDKSMCLVVFAIVAGLATTALGSGVGAEHDYPGNRPAVVPVVVHRPIRHRGRGRRRPVVQGARAHRPAVVRELAVHPRGPRVHGAAGRLVPPLNRLPLPSRHRRGPGAAGVHRILTRRLPFVAATASSEEPAHAFRQVPTRCPGDATGGRRAHRDRESFSIGTCSAEPPGVDAKIAVSFDAACVPVCSPPAPCTTGPTWSVHQGLGPAG
jgi:hypothetical protein